MSEMKIVKTVFLKAPPEHVWTFLTEADKLALWFYKGRADLVEGEDYALETNSYGKEGDALCSGKVLEATPPKKLVYTFTHSFLEGAQTTCTWTLEPAEGGTILTLIHDGWENFKPDPFGMGANHDTGWDEFFVRLRRVTS